MTKKHTSVDAIYAKIESLSDMINNIKPLFGERIVIKCGGEMMDNESFLEGLASDIAILRALGVLVVLVHGAGSQLDKTLAKLKIKNEFFDGYRVTDSATMEVVEMVMTGLINKNFVKHLAKQDLNAIGISGKDGNLITAKKIRRTQRDEGSNIERIIELGFIGDPSEINIEFLEDLIENSGIIPIISPVAFDKNFATYSLNADVLACFLGEHLKASKVIIMSENNTIRSSNGQIAGAISLADIEKMLYTAMIEPKMIIRLKACLSAIKNGVANIHIICTNRKHSLLAEFASGNTTGTMIYHEI